MSCGHRCPAYLSLSCLMWHFINESVNSMALLTLYTPMFQGLVVLSYKVWFSQHTEAEYHIVQYSVETCVGMPQCYWTVIASVVKLDVRLLGVIYTLVNRSYLIWDERFAVQCHLHVAWYFVVLQEEQRLRAKQAKEDLEDFLLTTDKIHSNIKYR